MFSALYFKAGKDVRELILPGGCSSSESFIRADRGGLGRRCVKLHVDVRTFDAVFGSPGKSVC